MDKWTHGEKIKVDEWFNCLKNYLVNDKCFICSFFIFGNFHKTINNKDLSRTKG